MPARSAQTPLRAVSCLSLSLRSPTQGVAGHPDGRDGLSAERSHRPGELPKQPGRGDSNWRGGEHGGEGAGPRKGTCESPMSSIPSAELWSYGTAMKFSFSFWDPFSMAGLRVLLQRNKGIAETAGGGYATSFFARILLP